MIGSAQASPALQCTICQAEIEIVAEGEAKAATPPGKSALHHQCQFCGSTICEGCVEQVEFNGSRCPCCVRCKGLVQDLGY